MSGWGDGNLGWGKRHDNYYQEDGGYHPTQGMSAASYDFHAHKGHKNIDRGGWEYGVQQKYGYYQTENLPWSTAADDDDPNYNQMWRSSHDQRRSQMMQQPQFSQQAHVGWRTSDEYNGRAYRSRDAPPSSWGSSENCDRSWNGGRRQHMRLQDGYREDAPAQKKIRDTSRESNDDYSRKMLKVEQPSRQWHDQETYRDRRYCDSRRYYNRWEERSMNEQYSKNSWRDEEYYPTGAGLGDWSQIPPSQQPTSWDGQEEGYYDRKEAYTYQHNYGGYEDHQEYYDSADRHSYEHRSENDIPREKNRDEDFPEDKMIYRKHRALAQDRDGREFLLRAVKGVMHSMKEASEILGAEQSEPSSVSVKGDVEKVTQKDEGAEKGVVDEMSEEENPAEAQPPVNTVDKPVSVAENTAQNGEENSKIKLPPKILIGVVRVGPAKRRILTKEATQLGAELVAVFKCKPTKAHITKLAELIKKGLHQHLQQRLVITPNQPEEIIEITASPGTSYPITVRFTSPQYGRDFPENEDPEPEDVLDEKKCKDALARIRRVRWSVNKTCFDEERPLIRIFVDITTRLAGWKSLTPYAAEVLVHTVMEKLSKDVRESEIHISRVFMQCLEVLAEGMLLPGGPGLKDPCEVEPTDVFGNLTAQECEDLTKASQRALRMISCHRLEELLELEESQV